MSRHSERVYDIGPNGWSTLDTATIELYNTDTTSLNNISLFIRYDNSFEQGMLPLEIIVTAPDSSRYSENITVRVQRPENSFTGHLEYITPYRLDNVLPQQGSYKFNIITHSEIEGISAIGLKITRI